MRWQYWFLLFFLVANVVLGEEQKCRSVEKDGNTVQKCEDATEEEETKRDPSYKSHYAQAAKAQSEKLQTTTEAPQKTSGSNKPKPTKSGPKPTYYTPRLKTNTVYEHLEGLEQFLLRNMSPHMVKYINENTMTVFAGLAVIALVMGFTFGRIVVALVDYFDIFDENVVSEVEKEDEKDDSKTSTTTSSVRSESSIECSEKSDDEDEESDC